MVLVTSCDDGPNMVCESSCVFPQDDEKFWSSLLVGNDGYRHEKSFVGQSKKQDKAFTDKNAICSSVCVCVRVPHACKSTDKTSKAPGFNYLIYRDINSSPIKQVRWRYRRSPPSLICPLQRKLTTKPCCVEGSLMVINIWHIIKFVCVLRVDLSILLMLPKMIRKDHKTFEHLQLDVMPFLFLINSGAICFML